MDKELRSKLTEFKIYIKNTQQNYVDGIILGLVHSGYNTYFDFEKENIVFQGWKDEVMDE